MAFKAGQKLRVIDLNGFSAIAGLKVGDVVTALSGERGDFIDIYLVEDETGDTFLTDDLNDIDEGNKVAVFQFSRLGTMKRPPVPAPVIS